jgi:hypothetical protein
LIIIPVSTENRFDCPPGVEMIIPISVYISETAEVDNAIDTSR